jgi:hypothetical protein
MEDGTSLRENVPQEPSSLIKWHFRHISTFVIYDYRVLILTGRKLAAFVTKSIHT